MNSINVPVPHFAAPNISALGSFLLFVVRFFGRSCAFSFQNKFKNNINIIIMTMNLVIENIFFVIFKKYL